MIKPAPIGVFDSGYGGLTVFKEIVRKLPQYDYIYLGDNARAPYGPRDFETIYQYTWECVQHLFDKGCHLVILACNTASAKALRTIQQQNLAQFPGKRVLGVIRPTTELIGHLSQSRQVGILATKGTVSSQSYVLEINKFFPDIKVFQQACPMWVPLIENNEHLSEGADYFVQKYIDALLIQSGSIDTVVLGCTHYPLLRKKIRQILNPEINILEQGEIVADRLIDYLERHPELEILCSKHRKLSFFTTESVEDFDMKAGLFLGQSVGAQHLRL